MTAIWKTLTVWFRAIYARQGYLKRLYYSGKQDRRKRDGKGPIMISYHTIEYPGVAYFERRRSRRV